mgnify:CR=1 FL=1
MLCDCTIYHSFTGEAVLAFEATPAEARAIRREFGPFYEMRLTPQQSVREPQPEPLGTEPWTPS